MRPPRRYTAICSVAVGWKQRFKALVKLTAVSSIMTPSLINNNIKL
jgi:hypothetical protein